MWVLDIQNPGNNTAKTAFRIQEIKQVFSNAYNVMTSEQQKYEKLKQQNKVASLKDFEVISKLLA